MWSHKSEFLSRHLLRAQPFLDLILNVILRRFFGFVLLKKNHLS